MYIKDLYIYSHLSFDNEVYKAIVFFILTIFSTWTEIQTRDADIPGQSLISPWTIGSFVNHSPTPTPPPCQAPCYPKSTMASPPTPRHAGVAVIGNPHPSQLLFRSVNQSRHGDGCWPSGDGGIILTTPNPQRMPYILHLVSFLIFLYLLS